MSTPPSPARDPRTARIVITQCTQIAAPGGEAGRLKEEGADSLGEHRGGHWPPLLTGGEGVRPHSASAPDIFGDVPRDVRKR